MEFSDDEIKEQLAALGYFDISDTKLQAFRKDLSKLVQHDLSSGSSWLGCDPTSVSPSVQSDGSPILSKKTNLSRYQPHVKVSPRMEVPPLFYTATMSSPQKLMSSSPNYYDAQSDLPTASSQDTLERRNRIFEFKHQDEKESEPSPRQETYPKYTYDRASPVNATQPVTSVNIHRSGTSMSDRSPSPDNDRPRSMNESTISNESSSAPKVIRKRKVMRKQSDGTSQIFDESLMSDGSESFRNHNISIDDGPVRYGIQDRVPFPARPHSAVPMTRQVDAESVRNEPLPSFIRPNTAHPHMRNLKKTDPVNKYFKYKESWNNIKAPGEKSHKDLRWQVKAQLMCKDVPPPKPQRVYVPNTYVVPTSKKRSALRWEVRHALERGYPVPPLFSS